MNHPSKFIPGDLVQRTKSGGAFSASYRFTVKKITELDGEEKQYAVDKNGSHHAVDLLIMVKPVPRPWAPQPGEIIRVTNLENPKFFSERKFLCMHDGHYVCQTHMDGDDHHQYCGYKYARPMPADTTITLANGAKVKLSEESYEALIRGVNHNESK